LLFKEYFVSLQKYINMSRKKSILKTNMVEVENHIDTDTGEVIESNIKRHTYLADSKEQFLLLYVNALPIFIGLSAPAKSIYAYLLRDFNSKSIFEIGGGLRGLMARELHIGSSTILNALRELTENNLLYIHSKGLYQINPRYAFRGSTGERNTALKALIEISCTV
jgi:hypothetical protein